jgi:hypothetical protein
MSDYEEIKITPCDYNYIRYVGWNENDCLKKLYSKESIDFISKKVTELTRGVDKKNRKIIVPNDIICKTIDSVYQVYRRPVGDIYSRYIVPNNEQQNSIQSIMDQTIEVIVSYIRNEFGMIENNEKLTAWVQVYGDFNISGLRYHPIIKTLDKRPATMQFNMNY